MEAWVKSPLPPVDRAMSNILLATLQPHLRAAILSRARLVELGLRQPLYRRDGPIDAVYFPCTGMISMVIGLEDGMQVEVGVVGREMMAGLSVLSGATTSFVDSMVQLPGSAYVMASSDFRSLVHQDVELLQHFAHASEALQAQIMQTAACNSRHGLEARLARWLLMAHDRVEGDEIVLTHEFLAMMLGVHRPSLTVMAGTLQRLGLIQYTPGRITVTDRAGLEAASCECHEIVRRRHRELFGARHALACEPCPAS